VSGLPSQAQSWDDLLGPARDQAEVIEVTKRLMGIEVPPRARSGDGLPEVGDLAASLGLADG
jgi:hypothetical protein